MDKPANRFYGKQRVEIKHGLHGNIYVHDAANGEISIIQDTRFTAEEMRGGVSLACSDSRIHG